jgi:hypothetical protein
MHDYYKCDYSAPTPKRVYYCISVHFSCDSFHERFAKLYFKSDRVQYEARNQSDYFASDSFYDSFCELITDPKRLISFLYQLCDNTALPPYPLYTFDVLDILMRS